MPTVPAWIEQYATVVGPEPDDVIEEMDEYAEREGFPTVGPAVGGWLRLVAPFEFFEHRSQPLSVLLVAGLLVSPLSVVGHVSLLGPTTDSLAAGRCSRSVPGGRLPEGVSTGTHSLFRP